MPEVTRNTAPAFDRVFCLFLMGMSCASVFSSDLIRVL
ncbi:Unknown protein sequence [Pseudomonas savastanoi pv. glycinea]|nr:Unknown protein sequence [Pseudomonas savastanoi pv. glycinea]KPC39178.1 Unknown protein sequence [Pseudomonas savastanoi pv. glycinea]